MDSVKSLFVLNAKKIIISIRIYAKRDQKLQTNVQFTKLIQNHVKFVKKAM